MLFDPHIPVAPSGLFLLLLGRLGDDDLFKVAQLCQVGGDAADLRFGALLPRAVDRRGGERLALYTLAGHLKGTTQAQCFVLHPSQLKSFMHKQVLSSHMTKCF